MPILAAQNGNSGIVEYLIEANTCKPTAIRLVAQNLHIYAIKYLIEGNADVKMQFKDGHTALILADQKEHSDMQAI